MPERAEHSAQLRKIQIVLRWAWDPIGVRSFPAGQDEYYMYAPALFEMLDRGTTDEVVASHLAWIERDRMGLTPRFDKNKDVAAMLRELHAVAS